MSIRIAAECAAVITRRRLGAALRMLLAVAAVAFATEWKACSNAWCASPTAQLSWSQTSTVTDLFSATDRVTLYVRLTSGVTQFRGADVTLSWDADGSQPACAVRLGLTFPPADAGCTGLNSGTSNAVVYTDAESLFAVEYQRTSSYASIRRGETE